MYIKLAGTYELVFIDTAVGDSLDSLIKQNGLVRKEATKALRKGEFNIVVPIGCRFSDGTYSYIVIENIEGTTNSILQCETPGIVGNAYYGLLTPLSYLSNLTKAELTDIIDLGSNKETDEELRQRYMESVTAPQFGGNITDYQIKTKSLEGVGGVKVVPIWNGGGTVKLIITNSAYGVPSKKLIKDVQNAIDPTGDQTGIGIAPIGHIVTVFGAEAFNISISAKVVLKDNMNVEDIKKAINEAIDNYFLSLSMKWDKEESLIIRVSQIETRMLGVNGIIDITDTKINNQYSNIILKENQIPKRNGDVIING